MATRSPIEHHSHWGTYAGAGQLPNVAGSPTQDGALEAGDTAYDSNTQTLHVCKSAVLGAAVWQALTGTGAVSALLAWGDNSVTSGANTRFLHPWYASGTAQTSIIDLVAPRDGLLRNMYVRHNRANGNGNNVVYTLMKNGAATAMTVTLASGAIGTGSDLVNTVGVAAGDLLAMRAVKPATINSGVLVPVITMELV